MRAFLLLLLLNIIITPYAQENIGQDSGKREITLYKNSSKGNTALLIIGGMHGDEQEGVTVVEYVLKHWKADIPTYFIPALNPSLYSENRRGYLTKNLDSKGYIISDQDISQYNKSQYYRVFYGSGSVYSNNIAEYVDPNRDFITQNLPSTKVLVSLLGTLKSQHKKVIIISIHTYMKKGRVYPEYHLTEDGVSINEEAWSLTKAIQRGSGYISEQLYAPSITIIDRFQGELIAYTGRDDQLLGIDIELDSLDREFNSERTLRGLEELAKELEDILQE